MQVSNQTCGSSKDSIAARIAEVLYRSPGAKDVTMSAALFSAVERMDERCMNGSLPLPQSKDSSDLQSVGRIFGIRYWIGGTEKQVRK
jgi:hypothetical protein